MSENPAAAALRTYEQLVLAAMTVTATEGERYLLVDGGAYSPSERAIAGVERLYQTYSDDDWLVFSEELDILIAFYDIDGRSMGWEDGCLFVYRPEEEG